MLCNADDDCLIETGPSIALFRLFLYLSRLQYNGLSMFNEVSSPHWRENLIFQQKHTQKTYADSHHQLPFKTGRPK